MKKPLPLHQIETMSQFMRNRFSLKWGKPVMLRHIEGFSAPHYPLTFRRLATGESLTLSLFVLKEEAEKRNPFDTIALFLKVTDWHGFARFRRNDGMKEKDIRAEWHGYRLMRKQLVRFFTSQEREQILLGLQSSSCHV